VLGWQVQGGETEHNSEEDGEDSSETMHQISQDSTDVRHRHMVNRNVAKEQIVTEAPQEGREPAGNPALVRFNRSTGSLW